MRTRMRTDMSTDAPTAAMPRVPAAVAAVTDARVPVSGGDANVAAAEPAPQAATQAPDTELAAPEPEAEVAAPEPSTELSGEKWVEHMYEAGLATLEGLHDGWAAVMAEIRQAPASGTPAEAAA